MSLDVLNWLLWVPVGSFGKITETTMIYSVNQVAQERGYPLSRQCHQYLEGSCFFFSLMILTCLTLFFSQNDFLERTSNKEFPTPTAWCQANTLSINYSKSKFMVFKPRQKRQNFDIKLEISDCAIERVRDIIFFMLTPILFTKHSRESSH